MTRSSSAALTVVVALASVGVFAYFLGVSDFVQDGQDSITSRRLQAVAASAHKPFHWGPRQTAALVLSVLVSLTSSLDRECGASLYVVLFAVVLNWSFRRAAAMTAFTVALGALGPGIASMSEARLTERGVLPLCDFPGALVLLPTMFWGISFGVIVNLWFPNWLLALIWVLAMAASNVELLLSFLQYIKVKKEARAITAQLRLVSPPASSAGGALGPTAATAAAGGVEMTKRAAAAAAGEGSSQQQQQQQGVGGGMSRGEVMRERASLMEQAQALAKQAHRIEARALLYPTLYVPAVSKALQKANIDPNPCGLRLTATPSCLGVMDVEEERLASELKSYQQVFGRFTFSWKKWWQLNRMHFELMLVLKIVVLHLVTEAVRHHTAKPCSGRFWFMVVGMTGLVTVMLMYSVTCYGRRRLWRGPHWVDALNQVRLIKKEQQVRELQELQAVSGKDSLPSSPTGVTSVTQQQVPPSQQKISAATAAVSAGEAVAVEMMTNSNSRSGSHDGAAVVNDAAAAAGGDGVRTQQQQSEDIEQQVGCWGRFKSKMPWVWVTGPEAVSNINYCNSYNQWKNWKVPLILTCAAVTLPVGIFGCALGLPGGPIMAHMLLALGVKPEVVAGTSRFLVLCFTFGSFVAHIISGGLEPTLATAFGLLNLVIAPLGMFLVTRIQPRGLYVIGFSLFMGLTGLFVVTVWQLIPLMAALAYASKTGDHLHAPIHIGHGAGIQGSLIGMQNTFDLNRFCHSKHH